MAAPTIIIAYGLVRIEHAVKRAGEAAQHGDCWIVVGITRYGHMPRAAWLVGLSRRGDPVTWVSAHRLKRRAGEQAAHVCSAAIRHDLTDDPTFAALLQQLAAHSDQALPAVPPAVGHA